MAHLDYKGWLSAKEREYIFAMAKDAETVLNIGIEYGASLHCIRDGNPKAKIVAIDLIGGDKLDRTDLFPIKQTHIVNDDNKVTVDKNKLREGHLLIIKGDSGNIELLKFKPDLSFIDGCHDYTWVKADIARYSRITQKYLLFHDYSDLPMHDGVKRALDEWQSDNWKYIAQIDTIRVYERVKNAK